MRLPWLRRTRACWPARPHDSCPSPSPRDSAPPDGLRGPLADPVVTRPEAFVAVVRLADTVDAGFLGGDAGSRWTLGGLMAGGW